MSPIFAALTSSYPREVIEQLTRTAEEGNFILYLMFIHLR